MTKDEIEREIKTRVEFKLNDLLSAVENTAKANWNAAFNLNSQKHTHYWEALSQMKQMLVKEINMPTPYNDMTEQKKKKKRDKAIGEIMERFCKKGERDYFHKLKLLASSIEKAQNF